MNYNYTKWKPLFKAVVEQHKLDVHTSCHGIDHWMRVFENGMTLSECVEGADKDVIAAFALLHDSARTHDNHCEKHGPDAIGVARELRDLIPLDDQQFVHLCVAIGAHTKAHPDPNKTISVTHQVCWDADRLDLERVMITPDNQYLYTDAAKLQSTQDWANERARNLEMPEWAKGFIDELN